MLTIQALRTHQHTTSQPDDGELTEVSSCQGALPRESRPLPANANFQGDQQQRKEQVSAADLPWDFDCERTRKETG